MQSPDRRSADVSPRSAGVLGWAGLALVIGYVDYVTGPFFSLTLFYLIPVIGASWTLGRRPGVAVALTAGAASLIADVLLLSEASNVPLFWNTVSRTIVLAVAAIGIDVIRRDRDRLKRLDAERSRALELLDQGLAAPARQIGEMVGAWDGSVDALKALLRPRADEIMFLARDFSTMVRLQGGQLSLSHDVFDLSELVGELRNEFKHGRRIDLVLPSGPLQVRGDRARVRQALSGLIGLFAATDDLWFMLSTQGKVGEVVLSVEQGTTASVDASAERAADLTVELAQLLLAAQGGSAQLTRNPMTRSLRVSAQVPLA